MSIEKLMTKNVVTLQADASVYDAVKLMNKNEIGCLIIVSNGHIVGILTERDLLKRVLEKCKNPKETKVSEVMTKHVVTGRTDMELDEATRVMFRRRIKKLPIVDGSELVGIVTITDIARATSVDKQTVELIQKLSNLHVL
ncbi:MAG: CBS domain-containing protein [Candidatus Bathyarchaeia archaeon]